MKTADSLFAKNANKFCVFKLRKYFALNDACTEWKLFVLSHSTQDAFLFFFACQFSMRFIPFRRSPGYDMIVSNSFLSCQIAY